MEKTKEIIEYFELQPVVASAQVFSPGAPVAEG